jgi:Zn-dependent M16 (insulinase) family peptidase
VQRFAQGIEQDPNGLSAQLASVSRQIFTKQNMRMALVAAEGLHREILESIEAGVTQFPRGENRAQRGSDDRSAESASTWKSGIRLMPLEVQNSFLGVAYKLTDVSGQPMLERQSLRIAATLLERHLWHEIRELGGAYGAFARGIPSKALLVMGSDVDPDPSRSLAVMRRCAQFLRDVSTEDMIARAKVVVIRQYLEAKTPVAKAAEAFAASLAGIEQEEMDKRLSGLFDVTPSDILLVADALEQAVAAGVESVHLYGPEKALRCVTK